MKSKEKFSSKLGTFLLFAGPAVISFVLVVCFQWFMESI